MSRSGTTTFISGVNAVAGSEFNDILTGNGGNNTLDGQGGNDVLIGNGGNDTLIGGTGSDIFVFKVGVGDGNTPPTNNDIIADFSHSDGDRIDLRLDHRRFTACPICWRLERSPDRIPSLLSVLLIRLR